MLINSYYFFYNWQISPQGYLTGPEGDNDYTLTIPSAEFEEGDVVITVAQDGVADLAGNTVPGADQTFQFNYDIIRPSLETIGGVITGITSEDM